MAEQPTAPRAEDLVSVGSRVSWGAILAGAVVALALYFLLAVLGAAVGVSVSDRVSARNMNMAAAVWVIVALCGALFAGGAVTSQFTVGENKMEAVTYGVIMWGALLGLLLGLGAAGMRGGFTALVAMTEAPATGSADNWHTAARIAGVSAEQIDEWRKRLAANPEKGQQTSLTEQQALADATTRISWYVFVGTWLSMFAAAAGAWVGAGPTFRIVALAPVSRIQQM
jgi:hypothetical protein